MSKNLHTERDQVVLDSINEGVFTVDLDWRITSFNRAAEQLTGVARDEAIGNQCCDVFHTDICESACALRRTISTRQPVVNETAQIVNSDGELVPIRLSTAVLQDENGNLIGGVETIQDLSRIEQLRKELEERYTFEDIVGRSTPMRRLFEFLPPIAESNSTVLLTGESGTGKELFARAIHNLSPRHNGPFIAVNCAALPDTLLESELFGHVKGAFTDAKRDKSGRFERANGGTLFLDEIGDVSPALQVKLLRVLEERVIEPLGAESARSVDVRIIAATNRDLKQRMESGEFREDLFYRINVIHLHLPPLRDRREDIPLLARHLLNKIARLQGRESAGISSNALASLVRYEYPGNVRELENALEQAFVLSRGGRINVQHLPDHLHPQAASPGDQIPPMSLAEMERLQIEDALKRTDGHRGEAATQLGIDPSTLYRKMKALSLEIPDSDGRRQRRKV